MSFSTYVLPAQTNRNVLWTRKGARTTVVTAAALIK